MKAPKVFCNRLAIGNTKGALAEAELALKGFVAGIIAIVEKHAIAKSESALIEVGIYLEWQEKCFGSSTYHVSTRLSTKVLYANVLSLMDAIRASAGAGNREIRVSVTIPEVKD